MALHRTFIGYIRLDLKRLTAACTYLLDHRAGAFGVGAVIDPN